MSISHEAADLTTAPKSVRTRDAAASKQALLQAAQELFGQKGYEATTIRDIGERAGVDAALIARYFGSKGDLYIAAVAAEDAGGEGLQDYAGLDQMADAVLSRADDHGPGPIMQAIIRFDTSDEIRQAALQRIKRRLVDPLAVDMAEHEVDRPQLRAQIAVAALLGTSLARSLGWFGEIRSVPKDELASLIAEALHHVIGEGPDSKE